MKHIIDIIEKLNINKVNLAPKRFPIDRDMNTIVDFLRDDGFKEIPYEKGDVWRHVHEKFNKNKRKKVFEYWSHLEVLRFADMSKDISEDNPIFGINSDGWYWIEPKLYNSYNIKLNKEEFLKAINKVFGWK